jgi:transglutaminase-like putative cysteine protease
MKNKHFYQLVGLCFLFAAQLLFAENYFLNGGQNSTIQYKLIQNIEPTRETVTVTLSYVIPQSFVSPTYIQQISDFKIFFSIEPQKKKEWADKRGNKILDYTWENPKNPFRVEISFISENSVALKPIKTQSSFPMSELGEKFQPYLSTSEQVPVDHMEIKSKSNEIVQGAKTQFDAVQRILSWVIDHMKYVLTPKEYGALFSLHSGRGNCQNYSHLSAALLRAQGIPVRIVNGMTLKEPYEVNVGDQILSLNMAQGRHSWIEVYFPDLGWMPFDPQQSELFVSNRFIRGEVGIDNSETMYDGLVRWSRKKGSQALISFQESVEADFKRDEIDIKGSKQNFGPKKLLLMPIVEAKYNPQVIPIEKKKPIYDPARLGNLVFDQPYIYGNLDFPEGINFAFSRIVKTGKDENNQELQKNFLVETAEYITGRSDYAQMFIINKPIRLHRIGLALHKFGGEGNLQIKLHEDQKGKPGDVAAISQPLDLRQLSSNIGYFWVDFDFSSQQLLLTPDKYWITLEYSGSPIINWFYSYGKPVGPIEGTQMKLKNENEWSRTMGYEFNYRITGLTIK